jgi:hypothetical protein
VSRDTPSDAEKACPIVRNAVTACPLRTLLARMKICKKNNNLSVNIMTMALKLTRSGGWDNILGRLKGSSTA